VLVACAVLLQPVLAKAISFFIIVTAVSPQISGASFYFFTDTAVQYPEGPHFSPTFYTSVQGSIAQACGLLGIVIYKVFMDNCSYQRIFLISSFAVAGFSLVDAFVFARLNVKVGIPDQVFVITTSVLESVVQQWQDMPSIVIISQLCPEGMEAVVFALVNSSFNIGGMVGANTGALLLQWLKCEPSGEDSESAQFEYLWLAAVLNSVMQVIPLVLMRWLIPHCRQTEKIMQGEQNRSATAGSLWKKWTKSESEPVQ